MRTYTLKYVELAEQHAEKMAKRWALDVQNNAKTPTYKNLNEQKIIFQCVQFYRNFSKMFVHEKISEEVQKYFRSYAVDCYALGIPMAEMVYALILMRRHIWLYAEFQMIFSSLINQQQALDTLNRTILLFDYASYDVTREYQELMKRDKLESIKLLDILESNVVEIAANWAATVRKDRQTLFYHGLPKEKLMPQAIKFYSHLRTLLFDPERFEKGREFFRQYAETCRQQGIPLHEAIYALNVMRRQMWLHDEFQRTFVNALAHQQAVDSLMRIMLLMDYAAFDITHYYQERMPQEN